MIHSRFGHSTTRLLVAVMFVVCSITSFGAVSAESSGDHSSQVAKEKKCKKGYYRPPGRSRCRRNPMKIKPTKIEIVAAKLRDGMFNATAFAEFPQLPREGRLCGYYEIRAEGRVKRTQRLCWTYAKGSFDGGMMMYSIPVKFDGYAETATFVSGTARSNVEPLIH